MKNKFVRLGLFVAVSTFIVACGEDKQVDVKEIATDQVEEAVEVVEEVKTVVVEKVDSVSQAVGEMNFEEGSWAWKVEDFLSNGEGSMTFDLDQLVSENDDEISAEGDAQLTQLATILNAHKDLTAEIQGHTKEAGNAAGRTAKKAASAARAMWAKSKLVAKGVSDSQLTSAGYADEKLIQGIDGKDAKQRRITVAFTK